MNIEPVPNILMNQRGYWLETQYQVQEEEKELREEATAIQSNRYVLTI